MTSQFDPSKTKLPLVLNLWLAGCQGLTTRTLGNHRISVPTPEDYMVRMGRARAASLGHLEGTFLYPAPYGFRGRCAA